MMTFSKFDQSKHPNIFIVPLKITDSYCLIIESTKQTSEVGSLF